MVNATEHTIECDLCHREFRLVKDVVKEERVTLMKEGLEPHEVILTYLYCPCCGKRYPVIMDDEDTLPVLAKLRAVLAKILRETKAGFKAKPELVQKQKKLNRKLDFRRQKLAEKYYQSFYQLEDGTMEQLDYRYHAR